MPVAPNESVPGRELLRPSDNRVGRMHVVGEEKETRPSTLDVSSIPPPPRARTARGKGNPTVGELGVVERFDPHPIAREHERPRLRVPQCEGEHTVQLADACGTVLFEMMNDGLGVAARLNRCP